MIRWISIVDLLSFEESKEIVQSGSDKEFKELFFNIGFDITREIEYQMCLHRPMVYMAAQKAPILTIRWVGHERRDKMWMQSEYCSWENKLEELGTRDLAFQKELVAMGQFPNFTSMILEHIRDN